MRLKNQGLPEQKVACPVCKAPILFNVHALIQGKAFECSGCDAKIRLTSESLDEVVESMEKFDELKSQLSNKQ